MALIYEVSEEVLSRFGIGEEGFGVNGMAFSFAGYLFQRPPTFSSPMRWQRLRDMGQLRTIDTTWRAVPPEYSAPTFEEVDGFVNYTLFRSSTFPVSADGAWTGYALDREAVAEDNEAASRFLYSKNCTVPDCPVAGYDLLDMEMGDFMSILWNCGVTDAEIAAAGVTINYRGLLNSVADAHRLVQSLRDWMPDEPHIQNMCIVQVLLA